MSIFSSGGNAAAAGLTGGYGLFNQLSRYVKGDEALVHFIANGVAQVQFDACMSESHAYQTAPSQFPLESGASITDHINVAPITLQMTASVSDAPVQSTNSLINSGAAAVINRLGQKGGALATLAGTAGFTSLRAYADGSLDSETVEGRKYTKLSRASQVYNTLRRMAGYAEVDDFAAPKKSLPQVFDVVTAKRGRKFCQFRNMCITALELQRDASTGSRSLVFSISLAEVRLAYADSVDVETSQPDKSAPKKKAGEGAKEEEPFYIKWYNSSDTVLEKPGVDRLLQLAGEK